MTSYLPTGLNPGDKFQLIFVTAAYTPATSTAIGDYNNYVSSTWFASTIRTQVQLALQLNSDITWKCIGSTANIDAKDNVADGTGVNFKGIYRLDGEKVAENTDHLWTVTVQHPLLIAPRRTEDGTEVAGQYTWTGTNPDGTRSQPYALGNTIDPHHVVFGDCTEVGVATITGATFLAGGFGLYTVTYHLYALSEILTWPAPIPPPPPPVPKNQQVKWNSVINSKYVHFPYDHAFNSLINQNTFADYRNGYIKKLQTETTLDPKK